MTRKAKGTKESIGPGLGMISFELKSIHMFPCALAQGRNSGHHDRECKSKKGVYRLLQHQEEEEEEEEEEKKKKKKKKKTTKKKKQARAIVARRGGNWSGSAS